jgi:hypothetical protein
VMRNRTCGIRRQATEPDDLAAVVDGHRVAVVNTLGDQGGGIL